MKAVRIWYDLGPVRKEVLLLFDDVLDLLSAWGGGSLPLSLRRIASTVGIDFNPCSSAEYIYWIDPPEGGIDRRPIGGVEITGLNNRGLESMWRRMDERGWNDVVYTEDSRWRESGGSRNRMEEAERERKVERVGVVSLLGESIMVERDAGAVNNRGEEVVKRLREMAEYLSGIVREAEGKIPTPPLDD